jgi:hypothetical protein
MIGSKRSLAALAVVTIWGLSMTWLGLRRAGQSDSAFLQSQASLRLAEREAWFRVMAGETQLGTAGITLDTLGSRYRIRESLTLHLPSDRGLDRIIRTTDYYLTPALRVDSVLSRLSSPGHRTVFRAFARDGGWDTELEHGPGDVARGRLVDPTDDDTPTPPVPLMVIPFRLALVGALAAGQSRTFLVTDGWPAAASLIGVSPRGDTTLIFADSSEADPVTGLWMPVRFDTVSTREVIVPGVAGPLRLRVDARGTLTALESQFGIQWVREEFAMARLNFRQHLDTTGAEIRAALPVVRQLAVSRPLADSTARPVVYAVSRRDGRNLPGALFVLLESARQNIVPGTNQFQIDPESRGLLADQSVDPFAQGDDPAVAAFADSIDPADGLIALANGIRARVQVDTAADAAVDAAGALRAGRARPEGLARLAVAVLRRRGVQAQVAFGVLPIADTLYSHAWVEVYDRRRRTWSTIDPVSGRMASTRLVRVAGAGSSHPMAMLPLVADVRFAEVSPARPPEE